ncbi:cohesin domain-containing protein [Collimonas sp.]|jgi:general secretion pathway protein D|uniref:cohesin domain-containing protein n=1 Tax=Collimonas sp. TaxID=1963772 RepID=UPI002CFA96DA|nr:cohesin domain-containing protein [Collimonas sp.]HWW04563.1 cohesin domain-containing protein [Collimonas sp.]
MRLIQSTSKNWRRPAALLLVVILLNGCAAQSLHKDGQRQIKEGHVAEGLANMREALRLDPGNLPYKLDYINRLDEETKKLIRQGDEHRSAGDTKGARDAYLEALQLDGSNERARRGVADIDMDTRHRDILAEAEKLAAAGKLDAARERTMVVMLENPANPNAQLLLRKINTEIDGQHRAKEALTASQSVMRKPVTLQFRDANLRMVFEALSRTTGLNVIFDRDVRPDLKTTIFVHEGSVEDTVNLILLQNQLEKKVLNVNTMFIYPATAAKQKEYQELKVRTFHISNGDAKYILSVLKSVLKIKDALVDERTNTLVLRDTPEALDVAAKVIAAHDLADAEVMLEVEVLEISRDRLTDLGISWPNSATISTPTGAAGGLTLGALGDLTRGQLQVTPFSLGIGFKLQDTDANLLASPRIRVRDHEKAKILIGDKVPIITNTVTPVQTGSSVVTGSIQYIDVGIKLEAEPHVYPEGEVGIKLNLEVSNIVKEISGPSGSLAYQIGTRSASTSLRLRDGETQVLGGLISDSDRNAAAKVPGLGQLPIIGRLFSEHNGDHTKTEIVLSITPRIVRAQGIAEDTMRDVWSGTETTIHSGQFRLDPISSVSGTSSGVSMPRADAAPAPAPAPAITPVAPPAAIAAPAVPPVAPTILNGVVPSAPTPSATQPQGVETVVNPSPAEGAYPSAPMSAPPVTAPPAPAPAPAPETATPPPADVSAAVPSDKVLANAATAAPVAPLAAAAAMPVSAPAAEIPAAVSAAAPASVTPIVVAAAIPPVTAGATDKSAQPASPAVSPAASPAVIPVVSPAVSPAASAIGGSANSVGGRPQISWGKMENVKAGDQFKVTLNASSFDGVHTLPFYILYDPRVLSFVGASPGDVSSRVGVSNIDPVINDAAGRVNMTLDAAAGKFFTGSGALMNLTFAAKTSSRQTLVEMQLAQLGMSGGALRNISRPQPLMLKIEP